MPLWQKLAQSSAGPAAVLIRLLVGWVFISEGIQKFLFPAALGVGRFVKIGIPSPHFLAPFVGVVEVLFGTLIVLGLPTSPPVRPCPAAGYHGPAESHRGSARRSAFAA